MLLADDAILFNIPHEQPNQRVIHSDIDRTRKMERGALPSFCDYCESILTFYCKENSIKYKQGLNEITGPFVLIKAKIQISFSKIYNMFICFIDKFLTNYFLEEEFYSLQSSFSLLNLLLKYHSPEIQSVFESAMIGPDMYATSWILTIFAK